MYHLYILKSEKTGKYYIGQTRNLEDRVARHNLGKSISTRSGVPWVLVFQKEFSTRSKAILAEKWVKAMKSKNVTEDIIRGEIDLENVVG